MEKETWKNVKGYEGLYMVSNLGRIKSLPHLVHRKNVCFETKERILKCSFDGAGYLKIGLYKNGITKTIKIHSLVAIAFLNHVPNGHNTAVDHIDGVKTNNNTKNLRIVTQRFNCSVGERKNKSRLSSQYPGVYWNKKANKWHSRIDVLGKTKHLGYFTSEIDASNAYQNELSKIILNFT